MTESVLIAMSGGVDSSACALLLQDAGFECAGTTFVLAKPGSASSAQPAALPENVTSPSASSPSQNSCAKGAPVPRSETSTSAAPAACGSSRDMDDARAVAARLNMPHYAVDFSAEFGAEVIDRFCAAYLSGQTPNPCIDCNRRVKFALLEEKRRELGYDFAATGHYARVGFDKKTGRHLLLRGKDPAKDQSYVLFYLSQEQLAHLKFPLGELTKEQVRERARAAGLANAEKTESQDICFIPDGDYGAFIKRRTGRAFGNGPIVNSAGKVLGEHKGIDRYTIGQRKGLGIGGGTPLFVARKCAETNTLVVGTAEEVLVNRVRATDVNLIARDNLREPMRVTAKTHYRMTAAPATARQTENGELEVVFDAPIRTCAPGQALVLYDGDIVLGGGTISTSDLIR